MSLLSHRRALVLAGLTGMLLAGGTLATATAAQADDGASGDGATKVAPTDSTGGLTIAEATDKAEAKYPDCEATAAISYETADAPMWDVELTCDSGTVKYVTVDGDSGTVADNGSTTDDIGDSPTDGSAPTKDDNSPGNPGSTSDDNKPAKKDDSPTKSSDDDKPSKSGSSTKPGDDDTASDSGDAPGTGANADYE